MVVKSMIQRSWMNFVMAGWCTGGLLFLTTIHHTTTSVSAFTTTPVIRRSASFVHRNNALKALINVDESAYRDIETLNQWAAACGVQRAPGFQLDSRDGGIDWSAVTLEPLAAKQPVLKVPNQMILMASRAKQELGPLSADAAADLLTRLGAQDSIPQFYLFCKILVEYEKGEQSPWFPWLNSLPRLYFNAVSMTDFCYECLPPLVFSLARADRVKFDNFRTALEKITFISQDTKENLQVLKWAFNCVYTRSLENPQGDKVIVPMGDMFNHGTETEIGFHYDEEGNCIAFTTRDVQPGSPLRISYGCPTNPSALFATYGFLDESSPATFCKIMHIQPNKELRDMGYDFSKMVFYKDTGGISQEVFDVVLYDILKTNRRDQLALYEAHMNNDFDRKRAIHQHYFLQTCTALKKHVDTFLGQLDQLSAKGIGKDINEHPRLPVILKHNEFVKQTFLRVKANLDPMVAQAQAAAAGNPVNS